MFLAKLFFKKLKIDSSPSVMGSIPLSAVKCRSL